MTASERAAFEELPMSADAIVLRRADEERGRQSRGLRRW